MEKKLVQSLAEHGPIRQILAYAELVNIPERLRIELQRSGVHLIDTPRGHHSKDVVDHMIITDMFLFAMENPAPQTIVLISGDIDYAYPLAKLRQRGYKTILIIPPVGAHPNLMEQADIILEWHSIMEVKEKPSEDWDLALRYEPLLSAVRELDEAGNDQPTVPELETYISERFPDWRRTSGFDSIEKYIHEAILNGWISSTTVDGAPQIFAIEEDAAPEQQRFDPLKEVLKQAAQKGNSEPELALIGIILRSMMKNPLERLGVRRLKDYVVEAEEAGIVHIRQEGLQHYISHKEQDTQATRTTGEEEQTLDLLENALKTLEKDEILPTEKTVLARMRELKPRWLIQESCFWSTTNLLEAAKSRGVQVVGEAPQRLIYPKTGEFKATDPNNTTKNPFSTTHWKSLEKFLKAHPEIMARGRYYFAKRLQKEQLPKLSHLKLGPLLLLVQLAINRGWLYIQGSALRVSSNFRSEKEQV